MAATAEATSREIRIRTPRAYVPLLAPGKRYRGARGGRGSAKSWFFAELLVDRFVEQPDLRAVCVREFQKSLEMSAKRLIEDTISRLSVDAMFRILNTHIETSYGGIILFQGMSSQTAESIKSLEGFKLCWIEEAQSLSQRSLDLLRPTIREKDSEIFASWNPRYPTDPIDKLLWHDAAPADAAVVHTTYRDNPWFPDVLRREMEWDRARDPEKYAHVWLGEYERHAETRVFKNWRVEEFESPADATYYYGADWGFSIDPATLVRCRPAGKKLYIDYEAYRIGVEIDYLPQLFDAVPGAREWPITADSARPETISYLQRHGFPKMRAAQKGKDSVKEGVIFLQNYDIIVHPRCTHTIDELTMYSYKVDRLTGMVTPYLADEKNHIIDPLRYAVEALRKLPEPAWVTW
jgi:phage terminase large subunit